MSAIIVTDHAVRRYQERVANYSDDTVRFEIENAFASAKAKHKRVALKKRKNTAIVPCDGFFLICSHGKVVTVVKEFHQIRNDRMTPDPLELRTAALLTEAGIRFTRPDQDETDPANLDFFLPDFNLYIEVKQFHSNRIGEQLSRVPERKGAIVLMGPSAVADFERLVEALAKAPRPTVRTPDFDSGNRGSNPREPAIGYLPDILRTLSDEDLRAALEAERAAFERLDARRAASSSQQSLTSEHQSDAATAQAVVVQ